jgi:hypothetical protein
MISPESRSLEWISQVAKQQGIKDIALAEKTIRVFSLLEALARSGCPFLFKGGSSCMLHLNTSKRLSIDIDIICPPGTRIEDYLMKYSEEYGFGEVKLVERVSRTDVPKTHAKFFYQVAYPATGGEDKILLDVLFEEIHYSKVVSLPIQSPFLKMEGGPVMVNLPSLEDLLGDKLTAFAPHTTGIPFFKGERNCSIEIIKQLFDIASLFDRVNDLSITKETFRKFAAVELQYRHLDSSDISLVLSDIYNTAVCISLRGVQDPEEFALLQNGINRIKSFIYSEKYDINSAIVNAAKAAYLSKLLEKDIMEVHHFDPNEVMSLKDVSIGSPLPTKFNKFKKTNIEAFYYWSEIQKII